MSDIGQKGGGDGEGMSDIDQILHECMSSYLIRRCQLPYVVLEQVGDEVRPPGQNSNPENLIIFYCVSEKNEHLFVNMYLPLSELPRLLRGVGNMDDVAVKTGDGRVICYVYINGATLRALKAAGLLESVKESMKQQLAECCGREIREKEEEVRRGGNG